MHLTPRVLVTLVALAALSACTSSGSAPAGEPSSGASTPATSSPATSSPAPGGLVRIVPSASPLPSVQVADLSVGVPPGLEVVEDVEGATASVSLHAPGSDRYVVVVQATERDVTEHTVESAVVGAWSQYATLPSVADLERVDVEWPGFDHARGVRATLTLDDGTTREILSVSASTPDATHLVSAYVETGPGESLEASTGLEVLGDVRVGA